MECITVPVPYKSITKPIQNVVLDNDIGNWQNTDTGVEWSNITAVQAVCSQYKSECILSKPYIVCSFQGSSAEITEFQRELLAVGVPTKLVLGTPAASLLDINGSMNPQAAQKFSQLGQQYDTSIVVTRADVNNCEIHLVGNASNLAYTKFKCKVLLEFLQGAAIDRYELPLSMQSLVFGPRKTHLLNIFQQTAVNVHAPPVFEAGKVPGAEWDSVYLVGDPVQLTVAKVMLDEIKVKTDILLQTCVIAKPTLNILSREFRNQLYDVATLNATFVQLPEDSTTVRIIGTSRKSVQSTITAVMKLCAEIYTMIVATPAVAKATLFNLGKIGVTVASTNAELVAHGTSTQIHKATKMLAKSNVTNLVYQIELALELKDFLAGKKNGKISKVMTQANSQIWFEPLHEHNLLVFMQCNNASIGDTALALLEDELPAEQELFIAEPYHKQIIGAGGSRIQGLMRRYNVYIKFEAINEKVPNTISNLQLHNVLVRCPRKHSKNIAPAIEDLKKNALECSAEHKTTFLKLSRNHRRSLVSSNANLIHDIEKWSSAVINYPRTESRNTELLEITGLGQSSILAAQRLQQHLPFDYEFRVACNKHFGEHVGPNSEFAMRVSAPLRAAFNAQVQAFESVQVENDPTTYSQIMVSIAQEDDFIVNEIDQVVTAYLRDRGLDIIEKGPLSSNLIVDGTAQLSNAPNSSGIASIPFTALASRGNPRARGTPRPVNSVGVENTPMRKSYERTPITPTPRVSSAFGAPPSLSWRNNM